MNYDSVYQWPIKLQDFICSYLSDMPSTSVRRRPALGSDVNLNADGEKDPGVKPVSASPAAASRQPRPSFIDEPVWLLIFSFFAVILLYVHAAFHAVSPAVTVDNAAVGQFVEERARKTLNDITAFGTRPVGSKANEELTVDYLVDAITQIRGQMDAEHHSLDVDVQRVSGTFAIKHLGQFTNCYDNVNNVVAKLCPKHGADDSLLVNCHYDSAINSTGICAGIVYSYFNFLSTQNNICNT